MRCNFIRFQVLTHRAPVLEVPLLVVEDAGLVHLAEPRHLLHAEQQHLVHQLRADGLRHLQVLVDHLVHEDGRLRVEAEKGFQTMSDKLRFVVCARLIDDEN